MVNLDACLERLRGAECLRESELEAVCALVKEILVGEANLQPISTPVTVCGTCAPYSPDWGAALSPTHCCASHHACHGLGVAACSHQLLGRRGLTPTAIECCAHRLERGHVELRVGLRIAGSIELPYPRIVFGSTNN